MKFLVATTEEMPKGWALVLMLALSDEVRELEWAEPDEAAMVSQAAYDRMIVHMTDVDADE